MARVDKPNEEIGWSKIVFAVLIATDISLIAWLVQNCGKVSLRLLIICAIRAFLVSTAIVLVNRVVYRKIDPLEEL